MKVAIWTVLFVLAFSLGQSFGQTTTSIRAEVSQELADGQPANSITPADLRGIFEDTLDVIDEKLSQAAVDNRIASWARALGAVGTVPDAVLPSYLRIANYQPPATWAQLIGASGNIPFERMPFPDCVDGQVLQRGASVWGCAAASGGGGGGLSQAQVDLRIAPWALRNSPTGTAPAARLAASPAADEFLRAASGGGTDWASISDGDLPSSIARDSELWTQGMTDARIAPWARATPVGSVPVSSIPNLSAGRITSGTLHVDRIPNLSANKITSGTIAGARLGANPSAGEFLVYPANWRVIADADIPPALARDSEIETWAIIASTGADAIVPATVIDAALARNANLPTAIIGAGMTSALQGHCLQRGPGAAGSISVVRNLFVWGDCGSIVTDASAFTMSMARTNISTAAQQLTVAVSGVDPQHSFTVTSGCIVVGSTGAGWYNYSASIRGEPNKSDDADPTDESGPHRVFPTFYIQRTRGAATSDLSLTRNTHYYRGAHDLANTGQSPRYYWSRFNGRVLAQAGDRYCIMVDASAPGANQADYLTLTDGEIIITSDRIG